MQEKRIQFYDSFGDAGIDWMEAVFNYIKDETKKRRNAHYQKKILGGLSRVQGILLVKEMVSTVVFFASMYCEFISLDRPLNFTQDIMQQCREFMFHAIMCPAKFCRGELKAPELLAESVL